MTRRRRDLHPYLLMVPLVAVELVVHVIPTLIGVVLSFRQVTQFTVRDWTGAPSAGTDNYRTAFDPTSAVGETLWSSLATTATFTVLVVALSWALGLFAAVLLSQPFRGRRFFQVVFIVPFALPAFVTGIGWRFLLARDEGAVNHLLVDNLHLLDERPFWLVGDHAFWAAVLVSVWRLWPFAYLMLLASMTTIPRETYESAAINGARGWAQFRHVTWPGISRMNVVVVVVMALWSFNEFAVPLVLLGDTPPESATLYSALVYRQALGTFDIGLAAATNVALATLLTVAVGVWLWRRSPATERSS